MAGDPRTGRGLPMQHPCLKRSFKKLFVVPMPSVANKSHARNIVFELESATSFFASVSVPIRWTMNVMKTSSPAPSPNTGSTECDGIPGQAHHRGQHGDLRGIRERGCLFDHRRPAAFLCFGDGDAALGNNRWTGKNLCHRPASGRGQAPVGTDGELEVIE